LRRLARVHHDDLAGLLRALGHPVRVAIVERLGDLGEGSPVAFAGALDAPLATVSHHFRSLADGGLIELGRTEQRRGALQHFYVLSPRGQAAVRWLRDAPF
jgi:DNA-binding transcriptional ArsR family regulator